MARTPNYRSEPRLSGYKLRDLRKNAGLTQIELATILDLSRETISAVENGSHSAMKSIGLETVIEWKQACVKRIRSAQLASESEKGFMQHILDIFNR